MIDVKSTGAKGDGIVDDSPAIQAALDSFQRVYVPAGTYRLGAPLIIRDPSLVLEGDGWSTKLYVNNIDALQILPIVDSLGGMVLKNFAITGTPIHGIYINLSDASTRHLSDSHIEHIYVAPTTGAAIRLSNATKMDGYFTSTIMNCHLNGGVNLERAGDSVHIEKNTITGPGNGIAIDFVSGAAMSRICNNNVTSRGLGFKIGAHAYKVLIENNHFEKWDSNSVLTDYTVILGDNPTAPIEDCIFRNNSINPLNNSIHGLAIHASKLLQFEGNRCLGGKSGYGVYLSPSAKTTYIGKHNIFKGSVLNQGSGTVYE